MRSNNRASDTKEMKETLKSAIENLVSQEIRLLELGRTHTPSLMLEALSVSIRESKREVAHLTEVLPRKERATLVKKVIRETVEEEIERTIQQRGNPCLRCVHLRYYDWELNPYENFPIGSSRARAIGCDQLQGVSRVRCERFIETQSLSVMDHVDKVALLYELRTMFKKMRKIWEEYIVTP